MAYITGPKTADGCIFCNKIEAGPDHDRENYVVYRGRDVFATLNLYPYSNGHLLVLPVEHASNLHDLSPAAQAELIGLVSHLIRILDAAMHPDGYNVGLNLGKAAGAGIGAHLHFHIVPRWVGDTNFMTVLGETRLIPQTLDDTYDALVKLLADRPPDGQSP